MYRNFCQNNLEYKHKTFVGDIKLLQSCRLYNPLYKKCICILDISTDAYFQLLKCMFSLSTYKQCLNITFTVCLKV